MHKRTILLCAALLVVALVASCGGSKDEGPDFGAAPAAGGGGGVDSAKFTSTVSGKISFEGMPPANPKIQMSADPYCQQHAADNPTAETVKVSDGGLENVIVYVSSGIPAGTTFNTPSTPVEIDQHSCHYIPHVFTIMTNQVLKIKNSDDTLHNIHAFAMVNEQYNKGQARKDMVNETSFPKAEMPLAFKCDVHKWMNSFAGVFDHPFSTVSKAGGAFELKLLPGKYEITAWHEQFGKKTIMVEVKDNEKKDLMFPAFKPDDKAAD